MPSRRLTLPAVAALAVASLLLGALAAFADGGGRAPRAAAAPAVQPAAPALRAPVAPAAPAGAPAPSFPHVVRPVACAPAKAPAAEPVPQALLDAFGVLRRDRTADDALPADALRALRERGLAPFDPAGARLLRRTDDGGRAWVVPVRDIPSGIERLGCLVQRGSGSTLMVPKALAPPAARARAGEAARRARARARSRAATTPRSATPATPTPVPPPAATVPLPPTAVAPAPKADPRPGLAVVALGGAPAGAGGTLPDLVRGREPVAIDPCSGPNHDMLTVSGIVPDGVAAAFLTSQDGTAVRADVKDNAYAFVVPRAKRPEARYVVWTGGDGTPHVQPLPWTVFTARTRCGTPPQDLAVVSPEIGGGCPAFFRPALRPFTRPGIVRRGTTRAVPGSPAVPAPAPLTTALDCLVGASPVLPQAVRPLPTRPPATPAPKRRG